ncbi:class I SAM-dependent methyltransferase [Luedemannella helvata]|uniref:Class I SAM-dependent methyltransferase n=1 Tax=Luedemannella helvata TaxID=349315 RepID=A0ABN2KPY0_9ACTN
MPRSRVEGKAWISHEIARLRPATLLDVGAGMGTYSNLLRAVTPGASWSCVEIFEPYVQRFSLHEKYDVIYREDIRAFAWPTAYDVVILGDVLEHLTLDDARLVWAAARANARFVALSIPIVEYPQGPENGNVHEAHLQEWNHDMVLKELAGVVRWQVNPKIGTYLARGAVAS